LLFEQKQPRIEIHITFLDCQYLASPHPRNQRETNNRFDEFVTARLRCVEKAGFFTRCNLRSLLSGRFEVQIR
jgi:hypothetical protein